MEVDDSQDDDVSMSQEEANDPFTETVESILLAAQGRDNNSAAEEAFDGTKSPTTKTTTATTLLLGGPLSLDEMSRLVDLCATVEAASDDATDTSSDADVVPSGFALVDCDLLLSLVPLLEKHVVTASHVDLMKQAHDAMEEEEEMSQWLQQTLPTLLSTMKQGLEAASVLISIMTSPRVDRRVVSEDSIESCIAVLRQHLVKNVVPALNQKGHLSSTTTTSTAAAPVGKKPKTKKASCDKQTIATLKKVYKPISSKTVGALVLLMERMESLVRNVAMDDRPVLTLCSAVLASFEMDPTHEYASSCRLVQAASIELLTSVFSRYSRHRAVIMEDLFPLMLKLPTSKRSMRTIAVKTVADDDKKKDREEQQQQRFVQVFSILLVSLVQACVVMPTVEITNDPTQSDRAAKKAPPPKLTIGLQPCQHISRLFASSLLQRCSRKGNDGGASEFRPVVSNLVEDLLVLHVSPEYPASDLLLLSLCDLMSRDLLKAAASATSKNHAEPTYLATALDTLGKACASMARRLAQHKEHPLMLSTTTNHDTDDDIDDANKEYHRCYCGQAERPDVAQVDCDSCHGWFHCSCVGIHQDHVPKTWVCDNCKLEAVVVEQTRAFAAKNSTSSRRRASRDEEEEEVDEGQVFRQLLLNHLTILAKHTKSQSIASSRHCHISKWANELDDLRRSSNDGSVDYGLQCHYFLSQWDSTTSSKPLASLSDEGNSRLMLNLLATSSNMAVAFPRMLGVMVNLMVSPLVSLRKLSVKAISMVIDADPSIMLQSALRDAVAKRFVDDATSVREAVISLVGSYILHTPALANAFHSPLLSSLSDPGVSVRKRAVKIYCNVLQSNPSYKGRAVACAVMLQRAADPKEDDTVRDLIHELFHKLWLEDGEEPVVPVKKEEPEAQAAPNTTYADPPEAETESNVVAAPGVGVVTPPEVEAPKKGGNTKSRVQLRCDVAAEQMVEVVRSAGGGDILAALMKELLSDFSDADKDRKASERRKRHEAAQKHCSQLVEALMEQLLTLEETRARLNDRSGDKLVAIFRTIEVFSRASPTVLIKHLDTIMPYLKAENDVSVKDEAAVVSAVCNIITHLASTLNKNDLGGLSGGSIGNDLVRITYRFGVGPITSAVQALTALAYHKDAEADGALQKKVMKLASTFYELLDKKKDSEGDFSSSPTKLRNNVHRALSVLGSLCRNMDDGSNDRDSDDEDMDNFESVDPSELSSTNMAEACYTLFTKYLEKSDVETKCAALRALGGIFASRPRIMLAVEQAGVIEQVMSEDAHPDLQLEALRCWRDILVTEEARVETGEAKAKMDSKGKVTVSKRISGDQDGDATLVGGVLAEHSTRLFQMTSCKNEKIRLASVELLGDLLRQGLINPMETVPYLFALQGDIKAPEVRSLSLGLLIREGEKRPDMLRQRASAGVKQAYKFQRVVYGESENACAVVTRKHGSVLHVESIFADVFKECIRSSRKQREGLYRSLLGLFEAGERLTDTKQKQKSLYPHTKKLHLLSFAAQVLAHLPYNRANDPLFIIYNISCSDALHGDQLVDRFAAFLRPHGLASSDEHDENNASEDALERAAKSKNPSRTKEAAPLKDSSFDLPRFADMCAEGYGIVLLLKLKNFLRKVYSLSETRCLEYVPDAKERLVNKGISLPEKMPMFDTGVGRSSGCATKINPDECIRQYAEFRRLMRAANSSSYHSGSSEDEMGAATVKQRRKRRSSELSSDSNSD